MTYLARTIMPDETCTGDTASSPPASVPDDEHDFLMPGPTPTSNEGCFAWGASWVVVSLVLIVIVAVMSVGCFFISRLVGLL
jgi:hypothetical protein